MTAPTVDIRLHLKQTMALQSKATEITYGGAAGGGKSHLVRAAHIIWGSEIPGLQTYLFRRLSDDLAKNHLAGPGSFPELLAPWLSSGHVKFNASKNFFEFWNGARIWLCHCQHEKDMFKYQGAEIHVLSIDELTHFTERIYRFLRGRCRLGSLKIPDKYKGMFPRILNGTNPGGVGHNFVRRMWRPEVPYVIRKMPLQEGGMLRQYIPAKLEDNPTLYENDPSYEYRLTGLGSPALVKAMRHGDWNIVAGGAVDDIWDPDVHIIKRFKVPEYWKVDRTLDWGSAKPFSIGIWAEADGTEVTLEDGRIICPVKGTFIRIAELYGTHEHGTNEGVRWGSRQVARKLREVEHRLRVDQWIKGPVLPGPADNSIEDVQDDESESIAKLMKREGILWTRSDKSPGSRLNGLELFRERLVASKTMEGPGLLVTENCEAFITTIPTLPRDPNDPEDVDTKAEDHTYDESRYKVLSAKKKYATDVKVSLPR